MKFSIGNMFSVPLLKIDCEDWPDKKKKLLKISRFDQLSVFDDNSKQNDFEVRTNYHRKLAQKDYKNNKKIQSIFSAEIGLLKSALKVNTAEVTFSWFEESSKYAYHDIHNHGSVGYSAVCYVDYDEKEHTSTQFLAPFNNFIDGQLLYHQSDGVKEGTILFFPSAIPHYTRPNNSEKVRRIISFNLKIVL